MGCKNSKNIIKSLDKITKIRYECASMISHINIYNNKIVENKINYLDMCAKNLCLEYKGKKKDATYYLRLKNLNEQILSLKSNMNYNIK